MDFLQSLLENSSVPLLTAFLLGLMTAVSPCPLATNITATAFISKQISNKKKVLFSGFLYALGRAFSYTSIGFILYFGASKFYVARFFNQNGEKFLGPLLLVLGLIMLNIIRLNFLNKISFSEKLALKFKDKGLLGSFLLGIVFALAFCPYSGALFFGILIPLTIADLNGLFLPIVFAFATALPVILFTYLLAFAASSVGVFYNKIAKIERAMRLLAGVVFVLTGLYYIYLFFLA